MWGEERLIYFPERYPQGFWDEGRAFEDQTFETSDGLKLHGWLCPARGDQRATILWFHGNAGNISSRVDMISPLQSLARVFIVDYRGYGRSEGTPSEAGLYEDARAAWRHLTDTLGVDPSTIVVLGKSLGGGVATQLCTEVEPAGLIVQSSFTSIPHMARQVLPLLGGLLVRTKMASVDKVPRIRCPKLFIHSPSDEVVPYSHGRRLYERAAEPKAFYEVVGAGHNETWLVGGQAYLDRLAAFIEECLRPRPSEPT